MLLHDPKVLLAERIPHKCICEDLEMCLDCIWLCVLAVSELSSVEKVNLTAAIYVPGTMHS
jgi:hypothetical protein